MPVPLIKCSDKWAAFFVDCMLRNQPCILDASWTTDWRSRQEWVKTNGEPDLDFLELNFGESRVPVIEVAEGDSYGARKETTASLKQYIEYCRNRKSGKDTTVIKYLKDWHFQTEVPEYRAYELPTVLQSDWINNEQWTNEPTNPFGGDYRFVYFGVKDTWTPFHVDVLRTFSWSANICGRKRWLLVPPGNEQQFALNKEEFVSDIRARADLFEAASVIEFMQEAGQIVFIPSGWHHQVHNLEDTISINHNWVNGTNIDEVWSFVSERYLQVRAEIADCAQSFSREEFEAQCQLILKADVRLSVSAFVDFLKSVIDDRASKLSGDQERVADWTCSVHAKDIFLCKKSDECIDRLRDQLSSKCQCHGSIRCLCAECSKFLLYFDLKIAQLCFQQANTFIDSNMNMD